MMEHFKDYNNDNNSNNKNATPAKAEIPISMIE